jgi:Cu(I)/Ag(I) efflux system membrane fusion protein
MTVASVSGPSTSGNPIPIPPRRARVALVLLAGALAGAALGGGAVLLARRLDRADPPAVRPAAPVAGSAVGAATHASGADGEQRATRWQCPMHPAVVQDHPGECPICGMKLVRL